MFELFEKTVLTGLGFISLSQKKAEDLLRELQERYKVSEEDGKAFLDKMQGMARESRVKMAEMAEVEVRRVIDKMGLVPREEFDRLQRRVEQLEGMREPVSGDPC